MDCVCILALLIPIDVNEVIDVKPGVNEDFSAFDLPRFTELDRGKPY